MNLNDFITDIGDFLRNDPEVDINLDDIDEQGYYTLLQWLDSYSRYEELKEKLNE